MYLKAMITFAIVGVFLSLILGLSSVVRWEVAAVLIAVSLGIPSLIIVYLKAKAEVGVGAEGAELRVEREERKSVHGPIISQDRLQKILEDMRLARLRDSLLDKEYLPKTLSKLGLSDKELELLKTKMLDDVENELTKRWKMKVEAEVKSMIVNTVLILAQAMIAKMIGKKEDEEVSYIG